MRIFTFDGLTTGEDFLYHHLLAVLSRSPLTTQTYVYHSLKWTSMEPVYICAPKRRACGRAYWRIMSSAEVPPLFLSVPTPPSSHESHPGQAFLLMHAINIMKPASCILILH